jgi:hypothetical protein
MNSLSIATQPLGSISMSDGLLLSLKYGKKKSSVGEEDLRPRPSSSLAYASIALSSYTRADGVLSFMASKVTVSCTHPLIVIGTSEQRP